MAADERDAMFEKALARQLAAAVRLEICEGRRQTVQTRKFLALIMSEA